MAPFEPADLDRFRAVVARLLGLQFDNGRKEFLSDVLRQRLQLRQRMSLDQYLGWISSEGGEELRALASQLTVTETYFFRGADQLRISTEIAFPERRLVPGLERRIRFLSAGCASGEEPYSVAMLLRERFPELNPDQIEIVAFDINPEMIAKAKRARYHAWSMRETPSILRDKYFHVEGTDFVLDEAIRSMVSFEEQNLVTCDLTRFGKFDVILCRNVIMYLVADAVQSVVERFTQSLTTQGFLFLGYAETLRGLSQDYHLRHKYDTFYYQKREEVCESREGLHPGDAPATLADPATTGWMDAVNRASQHIDRLTSQVERSKPATNGWPEEVKAPGPGIQEAGKPRSSELSFVFELLRQERFREAIEVLHRSQAGNCCDSDAQILYAGLLTNCGDLEAAEAVCKQILHGDELNAGAHYLSALCREHAGDPAGAMEHDRAAIYLDNSFAMPHLHLGRLAKRSADLTTARRELEFAGMLLLREDPSRLLLFGGGFNREALVAFSRAELRACGGL